MFQSRRPALVDRLNLRERSRPVVPTGDNDILKLKKLIKVEPSELGLPAEVARHLIFRLDITDNESQKVKAQNLPSTNLPHRGRTAMATSGGQKLVTLSQVAPGATVGSHWNNANAEVYSLHAWPVVSAGVNASAEITKTSFVVHGNPSERELHFWVKNTGTTQVDIAVWAFWWNA